ncbi:g10780 [Coccomyxa elongata]
MAQLSTSCRSGLPLVASTSRPSVSPVYINRRNFTLTRAQTQDAQGNTEYAAEEVIFKPMPAGEQQLEQVQTAEMNSPDVDDSFARLNYHQDSEVGVNEQINHEYSMSYQYHAMSNYFNRDNVGLTGFAAFFRASSLEERNHAQQLMDFQATRGGRVKLAALAAPPSDYNHEEKGDALYAMELALALEKLNFKMLFQLHEVAEKHNDANFTDFVEEMLSEQAQGVKEVSDYVAQLRRVGKGLGVWEFDKIMAERATTMGQA